MADGKPTRSFSETLAFSHGPRKWYIALAMLAVVIIAPFAVRDPGEPRDLAETLGVMGVLAAGFLVMFSVLQGKVRVVVDDQKLVVDLRPHGERRVYPAEVIRGVEEGYYSPLQDHPGWGSVRTIQPVQALDGGEGPGVWVEVEAAPRLFLPSSRPGDLARALEALSASRKRA